VVGLQIDTTGSDRGRIPPMIEEIERCHGVRPRRHLVDGGFAKNADTEWAWDHGVIVYGPPGQTRVRGPW